MKLLEKVNLLLSLDYRTASTLLSKLLPDMPFLRGIRVLCGVVTCTPPGYSSVGRALDCR